MAEWTPEVARFKSVENYENFREEIREEVKKYFNNIDQDQLLLHLG